MVTATVLLRLITLIVPSVQDSLPPELRAAQAALEAGHVEQAVDLADHYAYAHRRDARGFLVLGDAYAARQPAGRFPAYDAYREARRLAPNSPEPPYRMARMGIVLGGDDGEAMAREGLERVLELDPFYRDAWDLLLTLYRDDGDRQRMLALLRGHGDVPALQPRLALLEIELEHYATADALLDSALARDPDNGTLLALRAQSALEEGDTIAGLPLFQRALAHAATDSADMLWRQAIGVASPTEINAWSAGIPRRFRGAWLASFWASRNPDLFAGENHRIVEHFARLRVARRDYHLIHPMSSYFRSPLARVLNLEPSQGEREFHLRCEVFQAMLPVEPGSAPPPGVASIREQRFVSMGTLWYLTDAAKEALRHDRSRISPALADALSRDPFAFAPTIFLPLGYDVRNVDTTAGRVGYNLASGLDDRGVMYLRFGAPARTVLGGDNTLDPQCHTFDLERWRYADGSEVRFDRPSAFSRGERTVHDMVFRPMNQRQFATMKVGLSADATSLPAPLSFGVWTAQFRDTRDTALTDLLVVSSRGEVAASLIGEVGGEADRAADTTGRAQVRGPAGRYLLLAQARMDTVLGRQAFGVTLRPFAPLPAMSDLLVAKAWAGEADRSSMIAHLVPGLAFSEGDTLRCYVEIYGLEPSGGVLSYGATYSILRTDNPQRDVARDTWPGATSLHFDVSRRVGPAGPEVQAVDILPGTVPMPRGRYALRLELRDTRSGNVIGRTATAFEIR